GDNNIPTAPQKPQNTPVLPPQSTTQLATATTLINQGEIPPAAQFVDTAAVEKPATHSTETVNTAPTPQTQTQPQTQPVQLRVAAKKIIPNTLSEEEALEKIKVNPVFIEEEEADPNNMIVIHDESAAKKPKTKKKSQPKSKPDPLKQASLVDIETLDMQGFLDIRYATSDNFLGQKLYAKAKCYLRPSAAEALVQAAKYALEDENPFYLCINDCYRPLSVQEKMWQIMPKPGFVANPSKRPSNHNRAMAVDITPCDKQGRSLLMPTEFDAFSPLAAAQASDPSIPAEAIVNRENLQRIMLRSGFTPLRTEWWHFDYGNPKDYSVLNVPL
ncbi:MAG: M15 family metallopeptidase, partial [Elusimicrobiota bacterium]|nr:M15 family metallopeptidase [Elusimicrobiota bacterium]